MIEQVNGRYINRFAELDKTFIVKGSKIYHSNSSGADYESFIFAQDGVDFNFSVEQHEHEQLKQFIGKEVFLSCAFNPFGKYSFQQFVVLSFEPIPIEK